jgi:hypothetical protein
MTARHVDKQLQYITDPVDHSQDTATVSGDPIGRCHAADRVQRGWTTRQGVPHAAKDIICYA